MMHTESLIDVAIALPVYNTYTYRVPEALMPYLAPGKRVLAPFRRRRVTGYILGEGESSDQYDTKCILDILDEAPLFPLALIPFFKWISVYYLYPLGEVLKSALPKGLNSYDRATVSITEKGKEALEQGKHFTLDRDILIYLKKGPCPQKRLGARLKKDVPAALINKMADSGVIEKTSELRGDRIKPKIEKYVTLLRPDIPQDRYYSQRKKIIDFLHINDGVSLGKLKADFPEASGFINYLNTSGFISIENRRTFRDPFGDSISPDTPPVLTREQQVVVATLMKALGKGFAAYLLSGVTGSGKTEVYMRIAEEAVAKGFSALVLVPEIALISQTERRFRARFGENIAILHSGLSAGQRYDQWMQICQKRVKIVIGARSAIFAPLSNIGVIIVDEEHDGSYKQDSSIHYNARDLAVVRAKQVGAVALLGSATPSIQSLYNVEKKKFFQVSLKNRVNKHPLPKTTVVDLGRHKDDRGIRRYITPLLYDAMKETLNSGEQVLLFLNRRGFASFPVCASCGEPMRCKNCDISLTFHKKANAFKCHFCGYSRASVSDCASCGGPHIKLLGVGTEKIADAAKKLFPDAAVARLDRDTTVRKGALIKILKDLRKNRVDILVGTQMVAKGHDFPNITLVGVICADLSLNFPDFRAGEQTFQLLAQVSGRAGRGHVPGRVIMQTYNPEHFSITAARDQDTARYYQQEIDFRKALHYPPFSRMAQVKISGRDKKKTREQAEAIGGTCRRLHQKDRKFLKSIEILGPAEAPLPKIAKHYRWQILLKGRSADPLHRFLHHLIFDNPALMQGREVKVVVDVDPIYML